MLLDWISLFYFFFSLHISFISPRLCRRYPHPVVVAVGFPCSAGLGSLCCAFTLQDTSFCFHESKQRPRCPSTTKRLASTRPSHSLITLFLSFSRPLSASSAFASFHPSLHLIYSCSRQKAALTRRARTPALCAPRDVESSPI